MNILKTTELFKLVSCMACELYLDKAVTFSEILFIDLFLAVLGLCCCAGYSLVAVSRRLIAVASLVSEHRFRSCGHGLSCSLACRIFPDQGWNPCLLH